MSKAEQNQELEMSDVYDTEITDDDYGFIIGPDGELKFAFVPEVLPWKPPKNIAKILKMFGIQDAEQLDDTTLH